MILNELKDTQDQASADDIPRATESMSATWTCRA